jgi:hypothetical protein
VSLRQKMGRAAVRSVQSYEPEKIFDRWEELFRAVSGRA